MKSIFVGAGPSFFCAAFSVVAIDAHIFSVVFSCFVWTFLTLFQLGFIFFFFHVIRIIVIAASERIRVALLEKFVGVMPFISTAFWGFLERKFGSIQSLLFLKILELYAAHEFFLNVYFCWISILYELITLCKSNWILPQLEKLFERLKLLLVQFWKDEFLLLLPDLVFDSFQFRIQILWHCFL